jgi:hypothetical protein
MPCARIANGAPWNRSAKWRPSASSTRSISPAFVPEMPYAVVQVRLDCGVRFFSNMVGTRNEELRIGMRVRAVFERATPEIALLKFNPWRYRGEGHSRRGIRQRRRRPYTFSLSPIRSPGRKDVVIKVDSCGVCFHDIVTRNGTLKAGVKMPLILGHEISGTSSMSDPTFRASGPATVSRRHSAITSAATALIAVPATNRFARSANSSAITAWSAAMPSMSPSNMTM